MYEGLKIVFQEYGDFFGKFCAPFFIHLLDKLHKNVGQNIPWIFLIPWQGISSFSSFLTRNFKPRKMRCIVFTHFNQPQFPELLELYYRNIAKTTLLIILFVLFLNYWRNVGFSKSALREDALLEDLDSIIKMFFQVQSSSPTS